MSGELPEKADTPARKWARAKARQKAEEDAYYRPYEQQSWLRYFGHYRTPALPLDARVPVAFTYSLKTGKRIT